MKLDITMPGRGAAIRIDNLEANNLLFELPRLYFLGKYPDTIIPLILLSFTGNLEQNWHAM